MIESQALMGQEKYDDSRQALAPILKANPSATDAVLSSAVISFKEKKYKDAEDLFRKAYQLNPKDVRGLAGEAQSYISENQPEKALQRLQAEIAKAPTRVELHFALGNVEAQLGRYGPAIGEYRMVLDASPKGSKAQGQMYLRVGEMQRLAGDFASAVSSFQTARQTLPDDTRVLSSLAVALGQANRWREARQFYEATLKLDPNNGNVLNNLAYGMIEHDEDLDQAMQLAQRAKQLRPDSPMWPTRSAGFTSRRTSPITRLTSSRSLVAKQPNQSTFRYHLAMALSQKGDRAHAKEELKKALESNPGHEERQKIQDLLNRQ